MNQTVNANFPIEALLGQAGISTKILSVEPANAGGNNRIYRLETGAGKFAVKQYFRSDKDQRDRLKAEYLFLQYADTYASDFVPRVYACDHDAGVALYAYVDGRHIASDELVWRHVEQAADFFCALNQPDARTNALNLPHASEACFSIAEHLGLIEKRIGRLREALPAVPDEDGEAGKFLAELQEYWDFLADSVSRGARQFGQLEQALDSQHCCVSPSDFGFHNALLQTDGKIKFIDFEYAGIDDPAKMVGDFFAQLAVPVASEFYDAFVRQCLSVFPESATLTARAELLRPVYKIKWCCIAMNVFLPEHMARRKFADSLLDERDLRKSQLKKARQILKTLQKEAIHGIH
ncbi:aminoglycoside phosphotransferase family protein [Methylomonas sp. YC3]